MIGVKLFLTFVTFVLLSRVSIQSGDHIDLRHSLNGQNRPSARLASFDSGLDQLHQIDGDNPCTYKKARHHVIPNHIAINYFQKAVSEGNDIRVTRKLLALLESLLRSARNRMPPQSIPIDEFQEMRTLVQRNNRFSTDDESKYPNVIKALATWMPFNFFIGPAAQNRYSDPRDDFEEDCGRIVGVNVLNDLRNVYDHMKTYIDTGNFQTFESAMNTMQNLLQSNSAGYRESMDDWVRTEPVVNPKKKNRQNTSVQCIFLFKKPNE